MSVASSTAAVPRDESSTTASPATRGGSVDHLASRPGPDYADMMSRYLGPQIMAAMADDDVTEIYVNPQDGRVRLDRRSRGRMDAGCVIGAERLEMFLNAVADTQATLLTPTSPTLQAELPAEVFRGARLQGFIPPVTSAASLVIRKRSDAIFPLEDYVRRGMMSARARELLGQAVEQRRTTVIAGGTGTGKTTLLGAMLLEIHRRCPDDRLVILEDTVELRCPVVDHLALRTTPELSLAALVKATLRTSPTRIVIGEVRDHAALDFLDAAATGHPGGLCTVHASSAEGALARLDRLAQRANVPPQRQLIAEAIDLVVVLEGDHRARRVTEIARVTGLDADGRFLLHRCTE